VRAFHFIDGSCSNISPEVVATENSQECLAQSGNLPPIVLTSTVDELKRLQSEGV